MWLINGTLNSALPFRLRLPDGSTRTSLCELSEKELAELKVFPCKEVKPEKEWTQYYGEPEIEVKEGFAIATYPVLKYSEEEVARILSSAQEQKAQEIRQMSDDLFVSLHEGYTLGEVASFERQKSGARDILAGKVDTEDAVYVANLADVRQAGGDAKTDATVLAGKIVKNALAAEQAIVSILGHQQGLEVKAREASTLEELEAIVW